MNSKGLVVAAIILAALAGGLYWSNRQKPADSLSIQPSPSEPEPKILALNSADIEKIELKKRGADSITLSKEGNGNWQITAPKSVSVDQQAVSSLLATFSELNGERLVEDKATNLSQYGLDDPMLEVDLTTKNGSVSKLLIGDDTPTGNAAYAMLRSDSRVLTLASFTKTALNKGLADLRDKRLITVELDKVTSIELKTPTQDIQFGHDKSQWQIVKPGPVRAEGMEVDTFARKVTEAKMDSVDDDAKKTEASFASGVAFATVTLTAPGGTQSLEVRKNKDDYYAKSSVVDGEYKLAPDFGTALDKKVDDFRSKRLFDTGPEDPSRIEIHDGARSYVIVKNNGDWVSGDGKKWDPSGVTELVGKIRNLEATKFAASGFASSSIDISVTSSDGKKSEKASFSKSGSDYLARYDGEAGFFVLQSSAIEDLQKTAADLKPAG